MTISVLDLFKVGIGPSSSHTVGPMCAAARFAAQVLRRAHGASAVSRVCVELFGSLGATGKGHGTDKAVLLGLEGEYPDAVDIDSVDARIAGIRETRSLRIGGVVPIAFNEKTDLIFNRRALAFHPNGMRFTAFDAQGERCESETYFSVGGGFIVKQSAGLADEPPPNAGFPFESGAQMLALCRERNCSISDLMFEHERAWRADEETRSSLLRIWQVMQACVTRGCSREGVMPGPLRVMRRAATLHRNLSARPEENLRDMLTVLDWVSLYALAVNEENATGGRVVTAPTNGAAGIIPAVLHYYTRFVPGASDAGVVRFLLTAGAIAMLYKQNASISGAEVGCQGEVGVACSMAAAALAEVMGGTPEQVENAAEIGMEHNLGLTCDPVGGQVQVPCIERNAMGAVKAINAARLALRNGGKHFVSLDSVIKTMRDTGADMKTKYKETARGGLALNVVAC
ncbi:L-serine ammonia-lyase [Paraburkholderia diazotrophica]|uniref:L-serine dehydratase n=1 Tax=Paraburkholderia diazotrophica TaxID=667676 RepID=A0A1H7DUJ3_9BURK|nr:L-serine ammonia-lyase [Paraburkholderia diazotrophica]SEK05439.1 L-serine dehydratase [Paraburkholderia diazotrophica]